MAGPLAGTGRAGPRSAGRRPGQVSGPVPERSRRERCPRICVRRRRVCGSPNISTPRRVEFLGAASPFAGGVSRPTRSWVTGRRFLVALGTSTTVHRSGPLPRRPEAVSFGYCRLSRSMSSYCLDRYSACLYNCLLKSGSGVAIAGRRRGRGRTRCTAAQITVAGPVTSAVSADTRHLASGAGGVTARPKVLRRPNGRGSRVLRFS